MVTQTTIPQCYPRRGRFLIPSESIQIRGEFPVASVAPESLSSLLLISILLSCADGIMLWYFPSEHGLYWQFREENTITRVFERRKSLKAPEYCLSNKEISTVALFQHHIGETQSTDKDVPNLSQSNRWIKQVFMPCLPVCLAEFEYRSGALTRRLREWLPDQDNSNCGLPAAYPRPQALIPFTEHCI